MGNFASMAMMALNTVNSAQQAKAQENDAVIRQRADIQQRRYQLQIQERDKLARLKRTQATQRARFGSQGLNPAAGSAAALLEGLRKDTERSISDQRGVENMRTNRLAGNSRTRSRINLLENRINTFNDRLGTVFNLLER